MRKIIIGLGLVFAIVGGLAIYAFNSLDGIIKDAIEKYGSEVTQTKVTLDKVNLVPGEGTAGLSGLSVANPTNFKTPNAFKLGEISVTIDVNSIASGSPGDPITIKEIIIGAPEVTYELNADGSNIDAIQNNVNSYIAKLGGKENAAAKEENEDVKLIIENLYIRSGKANVSSSILQGKSISATLPDIHLKDIGKDKGGASPGEVAEKLLTTLNKAVSQAVADIGIGKTLDSLKGHLAGAAKGAEKAVGGAIEGAKKSLGGATGGTTDALTKGAAGAGNKLKGLLGN